MSADIAAKILAGVFDDSIETLEPLREELARESATFSDAQRALDTRRLSLLSTGFGQSETDPMIGIGALAAQLSLRIAQLHARWNKDPKCRPDWALPLDNTLHTVENYARGLGLQVLSEIWKRLEAEGRRRAGVSAESGPGSVCMSCSWFGRESVTACPECGAAIDGSAGGGAPAAG
jgi:hypothetical protein